MQPHIHRAVAAGHELTFQCVVFVKVRGVSLFGGGHFGGLEEGGERICHGAEVMRWPWA